MSTSSRSPPLPYCLQAPYFTHFCDTWISQGHEEATCPQGYIGATFYVLIVMLLLHCEQVRQQEDRLNSGQ